MDATRAHDGRPVMLKALSTKRSTKELEIALFFSAPERKDEPQNHCVPVWDVLQSPFDQDSKIIVMPRLYEIDEPIFDTMGEALDAIRQLFEVTSLLSCYDARSLRRFDRASSTCTDTTLLTSKR